MSIKPNEILMSLRSWVVRSLPHDDGDVLVNELCFLGKKRRADLVHANGKLCAFEIKSEADNLSRWEGQQQAYLRVFEEVWLCCHSKHVKDALLKSDSKVGILVVDDLLSISVIRWPKINEKTDVDDLAGLLWRSELDEICRDKGIEVVKSERKAKARQRLIESLPREVVNNYVVRFLKRRNA